MLKNYTKVEVNENSTKRYFNDKGKLHRLDGPALEYSDGIKQWCIIDKHHRNIDPATEWLNGGKRWVFNNKYHRIGGPCSSYGDHWDIHGERYTKEKYFNKVWDI